MKLLKDIMAKVHADASNFVSDVSKQEAYTQVLEQARGLFYEQRNWVSRFISSVVHVPGIKPLHAVVSPTTLPTRRIHPFNCFSVRDTYSNRIVFVHKNMLS
jgi:hypothetical protein